QNVRMLFVILRKRAYPISAQELFLVEHSRKHPSQFLLIQNRKDPSTGNSRLMRRGDIRDQIRMSLEEPRAAVHKARESKRNFSGYHRSSAQRQQTDHRADFEPSGVSVREPHQIIKEAVLFIPHLILMITYGIHSRRDPEEVLRELQSRLFIA